MAAITRKQFLLGVGAAAGIGTVHQLMGLLNPEAAPSPFEPPTLTAASRHHRRILVLGAGAAGMMAAYELHKAGYQVEVLEASGRSGGRILTLRDGDRVVETDGTTQQVRFERGLYFNPGPWRIPNHHSAVLHYVREFGVQLEVFPMINQAAWLHRQDGLKIRKGAVEADLNGRIAELLAGAIQGGRLDEELSRPDREQILTAMREWGVLDPKYRYVRGEATSWARGWQTPPGAGLNPGVPSEPLTRQEVFDAFPWQSLAIEHSYGFQSTMFQPVGGMDKIAKAFDARTRSLIRHNAQVVALSQDDRAVTAVYQDKDGARQTTTADYCICTIPPPVLKNLDLRISPELEAVLPQVLYDPVTKVGIQYRRRFWEQDENIYGGISYTDQPMNQMAYPAEGFHRSGAGVVLGAYAFADYGYELGTKPPEQRLAEVLRQNAQLHPQATAAYAGGVSVSWHKMPWAGGAYAFWLDDARRTLYPTLVARHGRVMLAGEHASYWSGWIQGSLLSARAAVEEFDRLAADRS